MLVLVYIGIQASSVLNESRTPATPTPLQVLYEANIYFLLCAESTV